MRLVITVGVLVATDADWEHERAFPGPPVAQEPVACLARPGEAVRFEDPRLDAAVRQTLGLTPEDDLTCDVLAGLASLTSEDAGIRNLDGIENLVGLRHLQLGLNPISDLGPLSQLEALQTLGLWGAESSDLSPLSNLQHLETLILGNNGIQDIGPLAQLDGLKDLNITNNRVRDLAPLRALSQLAVLRIYNNPISDIESLRDLNELTELHIHDLPELSDITPLLENEGLGPGDRVILMRSGISCRDAATLKAKGVAVNSGCLGGLPIRWWAVLAGMAAAAVIVTLVTLRWRHRGAQAIGST